jgi:hypothetical protein
MAKKLNTYDDLYVGRFLKAGNFNGKPVTLTIKGFMREELEGDDGKKFKAVLSFEETEMQLVTCKTNGYSIKCMFGDKLSNWIGKRVTFFPSAWNGEPAIRVWGSPDIAADMNISIQLPHRKPILMTMHAMSKAAAGQVPDPSTVPPPPADQVDPDEFPEPQIT